MLGLLGVSAMAAFPAPFYRTLAPATPPAHGADVTILQQLLRRIRGPCALACGCGCSHVYDAATADSVACYTGTATVFDEAAARLVLRNLSHDAWVDDGTPASATGHLYKLLIPVHRNRSIETMATLLDAHNNHLYQFRVRAHGHDVDAAGVPIPGRPWPDLHDDGCPDGEAAQGCVGLNQFSTDGNTPTGLSEIDLNSPESSPTEYGPFPVNRFVRGLTGNAAFLLSPSVCTNNATSARAQADAPAAAAVMAWRPIRSGVLVHTGAWANHSGWTPGQPMPNSEGCVHAYPEAIQTVWQLLAGLGVQVRPNTDGKLPYPYKPQGLASVYEVGDLNQRRSTPLPASAAAAAPAGATAAAAAAAPWAV